MRVEPVDERDSSWENSEPRFRVYFFGGDGPGHATWTYDITDADVLEVVRWAQGEAGAEHMFSVALVRDDILVDGGPQERGLVWLLGMDANDAPTAEVDRACQATMRRRRGRQLVLADDG